MRTSNRNISLSLGELAERVGARVEGDGKVEITGAAPIAVASEGEITFLANRQYLKHLESTRAAAVVLDMDTACSGRPTLRHKNPYLTFARIIDILYPDRRLVEDGIHESAVVETGAAVDPSAAVGPLCHVRAGAVIGKNTQLVSSVYVGPEVSLGDDCLIYPGVRILHGSRLSACSYS